MCFLYAQIIEKSAPIVFWGELLLILNCHFEVLCSVYFFNRHNCLEKFRAEYTVLILPGLDIKEFRKAMKKIMDNITEEDIDIIFMKIDTDCDGSVGWVILCSNQREWWLCSSCKNFLIFIYLGLMLGEGRVSCYSYYLCHSSCCICQHHRT